MTDYAMDIERMLDPEPVVIEKALKYQVDLSPIQSQV
jgi:hypothetical protein